MRAMLIMALLMLAGCGNQDAVRGELPPAASAVVPKVQIVERVVYVKVPDRLTPQEEVPEGPIAQCFDVAAARRAVIERQNARAAEVRAIQGTEVKP